MAGRAHRRTMPAIFALRCVQHDILQHVRVSRLRAELHTEREL